MQLINYLNRSFGRYAVQNLTLVIIFSQVITYILVVARPEMLERMILIPQKVLEGEWWRLISFLAYPPTMMPLFLLFFWYIFYLFGSALEATWGAFNYNLYLLLGYLATAGASFLRPDDPTGNGFLYGSLFLAFAYLYPNFELCIMFVLPVKIKWLALLQWIVYGFAMLSGGLVEWIQVTASVCNFLIFFSPEIYSRARSGRWRMAQQVKKFTEPKKARHICRVCNATNLTHPTLQFRYCSKCPEMACFCEVHLQEHRHEEVLD
jgi:hypothetical protein